MKKGLRITGWILAAVLLLLLLLLVVIQSPAVQTALARKAVAKFGDRIDGDIRIGRIDADIKVSVRPESQDNNGVNANGS